MQIVYHIGAHCTDDGQIHHCLARNRRLLAERGVVVPGPGRFRPILRETMSVLNGEAATPDVQELMLDSILTEDNPERIIFTNDAFLCGVRKVLDGGLFYADAGEKCARLHSLFHDQEVEFCLAIRNPATLLPALFTRMQADSFAAFLAQADPMQLRWSDVISQITTALPNVPIKVWSNEDTPFIWNELIHELTDVDLGVKLAGLDDYLATIMDKEGLERMSSYIRTHPPANEIQRRRIIGAFLDKFEIEDVEAAPSAPGWTDQLQSDMTDLYEEDLFTIERMPGVHFICP